MRQRVWVPILVALGIGCGLGCPPAGTAQRPAHTDSRPVGGRAAGRNRPKPAPAMAAGPMIDATALGHSIPLDSGWRVGVTADPAAAQPDFDDSHWAVRNAQDVISEVPVPEAPAAQRPPDKANPARRENRYAWFRLHLKMAPNHGPIALLVQMPVTQSSTIEVSNSGPGVTVFANGQRVRPEGPNGADPQHYQAISRIYDLKVPPEQTSLLLAVRILYIPLGFNAYTSFFATRSLWLGAPGDLESRLAVWRNRMLFERLPQSVYSLVLVVLALFLFALYMVQRGHNEYLWLALHYLVQAPIAFIELAGSSGRVDSLWYGAIILQLVLASAYLFFEFLVSFLSLPRRWYIRSLRYLAPILAFVAPTLLLVGRLSSVGIVIAIVFLGCLLWAAGWLIFIFTTLIAATLRRNFEGGLLLVPLVLSLVGVIEPVVTASMTDTLGRPFHSPLTVLAGPIPIHFASIADFTGVLAIVIIIFGRFVRIQRDQQRASSELQAARSIQELMIPQEKLATPGFEVESVYCPANEVGGDFYHVQPMGDGGVLVVIGDVAGKGLKAAMSVSMIVGALRRTPEQSPARILESLNRVLAGNDSFTTCLAAWFGADGALVLASAGHLPPYLNSQEVAVPGGLPLGVLPDVCYDQVRLYLHPGDRILLLSDGVVEARRPTGELFGFDRVHNLSNQTAFTIADTARTFGQQDDITVLTVRRLAHPVGPAGDALTVAGAGASIGQARASLGSSYA